MPEATMPVARSSPPSPSHAAAAATGRRGASSKTSAFKVPGAGNSAGISVVTVRRAAAGLVPGHQPRLGQAALPAVAAGGVPAVLRIPHRPGQRQAAGAALRGQHVPGVLGVLPRLPDGDPDRHRDGHVARGARHLRSAARVLPAAAAAGLPAADHHLVRHRRAAQGPADLPVAASRRWRWPRAPACAAPRRSRSMPPIPWARATCR